MRRLITLPQLTVTRDGSTIAPSEVAALAEVRVQQKLSAPTLCELVFRDPPGPLDASAALLPGTAISLTMQGAATPLFTGQATAVEHVFQADNVREVRVRAYDLSHRLRKRQRVRAHVQVTSRSLAEELCREAGLSVEGASGGPTWELLMQHRQTDLELLTEVLERSGLHYAVRDDRLVLLTLDGDGDAVELALGETLLEARVELNGDAACREVRVAGWDPRRAQSHDGRARDGRVGAKVGAEVSPADVGSNGQRAFPGQATPDDAHAEGIAQAELDHRQSRDVTLRGVAEGDPRLRPGVRVEVRGLGPAFAGRFVLSQVTHTIDDVQGYVSTIDTSPPKLRPRPAGATATLGVVTQVGDPDGQGRVKARLPAYFDLETGWMEVVALGAGASKGFVMLPDVDDTVLVLLVNEDPAQGLILGGLYGAGGSPDRGGVLGGAVKRYALLSRGGQVVRLDDDKKSIRLEVSQGSFIELAPQRLTVHSASDLELDAPGKRILIRGNAVDFEQA